MFAVLQLGIGPQSAEECLLEGILGPLTTKPAQEESEDLLAVLLVEPLEGRQGHPRHPETLVVPQM